MTAAQVVEAVEGLMARYAREDAERRSRNAALLASL
jgi:hypothetical protein